MTERQHAILASSHGRTRQWREGSDTGYIRQIESLRGGVVWSQPPKKPKSDRGWQVRSAEFTMPGIDFGASYYGDLPAPMESRPFDWEVLVIGDKAGGMKYDTAYDNLAAAIGFNVPVLLVYKHDEGFERVVKAYPMGVESPYDEGNDYAYRFTTHWKLQSFWTERGYVDSAIRCGSGIRCGQVPHIRCGQGAGAQKVTGTNFTVPTAITDASIAGPGGIPTIPDRAPIITLVGPIGLSDGCTLLNLIDPFASNFSTSIGTVFGGGFAFKGTVLAGWTVVIDTGAWSATYFFGSTQIDRTDLLERPASQPYYAAIHPRKVNQFQLIANGSYVQYPGIATTTITNNPLSSGATTINVVSTAGYPTNGSIALAIGNELISYTGISGNSFTGCTRGAYNTAAASHVLGSGVTPMNPPWGGSISFKWRRYFN